MTVVLTETLIIPEPQARALLMLKSILLSQGQSIYHDNALCISSIETPSTYYLWGCSVGVPEGASPDIISKGRRLVGFEFEARRGTIGGIQISEGLRLVEFTIPLFVPRL
jgi:hypothetical protein